MDKQEEKEIAIEIQTAIFLLKRIRLRMSNESTGILNDDKMAIWAKYKKIIEITERIKNIEGTIEILNEIHSSKIK